MKNIITLLFILLTSKISFTQNVGIGISSPTEKFHVVGNIIVQQPFTKTGTVPSPAQTQTMVNGNTSIFNYSDSTGRIYDPGGPSANYLPNLSSNAFIDGFDNTGIELTIQDIELNTGDSLIIRGAGGISLLRLGKDNSSTGTFIFNTYNLFIDFTSNNDANVGRGFSLLFKKLFNAQTTPVSTAFGNALLFDANKGIFRAGRLQYESTRGDYSTALGSSSALGNYSLASGTSSANYDYATALGTSTANANYATAMGGSTASGTNSTAMGNSTASYQNSTAMGNSTAIALNSTAMGNSTAGNGYATAMGNSIANGLYSTAMGNSTANGFYSTAMGLSTTSNTLATAMGYSTASGYSSIAMGYNTLANGPYSVALGTDMSTNNFSGSFAFGDGGDFNSSHVFGNDKDNELLMRFKGGCRIYTTGWGSNNGVYLPPGASSWTTLCDKNKKENFEELNSEDILKKIAAVQYTSWNYKGQDPKTFRHYGIMAQDFYSAFGKDQYGTIGCDTLVNPIDLLGIAYSAIQALEKRTQKIEELQKENASIKLQNEKLLLAFEILNKKVELLVNAKENSKQSLVTKNN